MRVGIAGASGLVGYGLFRHLRKEGVEAVATFHSRPRPGLVPFDLLEGDPSLFGGCSHVILAAALSRLDQCRQEETLARRLNVEATLRLAFRVAEGGARPVFLSSDQVFDGKRGGYREEDPTNPVNRYGAMKREVEEVFRREIPNGLVLRLSKTYSRTPGDGGMWEEVAEALRAGREVPAARDQIYNPTDVTLVSRLVLALLRGGMAGLFHVAGPVIQSRLDFALGVALEVGAPTHLVRPIELGALPLLEPRALNSSLDVSLIRDLFPGLFPPQEQEGPALTHSSD